MRKKDLQKKINRQKAIDKLNWLKYQIKECSDYMEVGTVNWLREMCFHAVKYLSDIALKMSKKVGINFRFN